MPRDPLNRTGSSHPLSKFCRIVIHTMDARSIPNASTSYFYLLIAFYLLSSNIVGFTFRLLEGLKPFYKISVHIYNIEKKKRELNRKMYLRRMQFEIKRIQYNLYCNGVICKKLIEFDNILDQGFLKWGSTPRGVRSSSSFKWA